MEKTAGGAIILNNGMKSWRVEPQIILESRKFLELVPEILASETVALDTESTGVHPLDDYAVGLCLAWRKSGVIKAIFVPIDPPYEGACPRWIFGPFISVLCTNSSRRLILHNSKFDQHMLLNTFGIRPRYDTEDTMVMAHLYDETQLKGLKEQGALRIDDDAGTWEVELEKYYKKSKRLRWYQAVPLNVFGQYGAMDAALTLILDELLYDYVIEHFPIVYGLEQRMITATLLMEREGFLVDREHLVRERPKLVAHIDNVANQISEIIGKPTNPGSNQQIGAFLYGTLGLEPTKLTAKGAPSVDKGVLERIDHPVAELTLQYRANKKVLGTYVDGILGKITSRGRIHPSYLSTGARTGRFSSKGPNLQQMPREGSLPISIRQAFIPDPGDMLLCFDYSQMEYRMFAHFVADPELLDILSDPTTDVHRWTAAQTYHKREEDVTPEERKRAKTTNFGTIYCQGAASLAWKLKISEDEARKFLRGYHRTFPGLRGFINSHIAEVEMRKGRYLGREWRRYIWDVNFFGRRRFFWPTKAYVSINTLIQGSCADVLKTSLMNLLPLVESSSLRLKATVHDEIILTAPVDEVHLLIPEVCRIMENFHFRLPLNVSVEASTRSWGEAEPWKTG